MKQPFVVSTRDRRAVDRLWLQLGGQIRHKRQSGEVRYEHPSLPRYVTMNARRESASGALLTLVNRLMRANQDFGPTPQP